MSGVSKNAERTEYYINNNYKCVCGVDVYSRNNEETNERNEILINTKDKYFEVLKQLPHLAEKITFYKQIKPVFDIDIDDIDDLTITDDVLEKMTHNYITLYKNLFSEVFEGADVLFSTRKPREVFKKKDNRYFKKISIRAIVQNGRISNYVNRAIAEKINDDPLYKTIGIKPLDLSIYDRNSALFTPYTIKRNNVCNIPLEPFEYNDNLFDYCCSYIEEDYKDFDKVFDDYVKDYINGLDGNKRHIEKIIKHIEKDDTLNVENDEEDDTDINEDFLDVVKMIGSKTAIDYDSWRDGCFAIINVCIKKGISKVRTFELCEIFSKNADGYNDIKNEKAIEDFYKSCMKSNGKKVGMNRLYEYLKIDNFLYWTKAYYNNYTNVKKRIEQNYFKILNPSCIVYIEILEETIDNKDKEIIKTKKIYTKNYKDISNDLANVSFYKIKRDKDGIILKDNNNDIIFEKVDFYPVWRKDENIRTYKTFKFEPEKTISKDIYNMWNGFEAERLKTVDVDKVPELVEPIIKHFRDTIGPEYWFIIAWMAHIIQKPYIITGVIILLQGEIGCGKNIIIDFFRRCVLGYDITSKQRGVSGLFAKFSQQVVFKLLNVCDEVSSIEFARNVLIEDLKDLATADTTNYESKGINSISIKNYLNIIGTSNNDFSIPIQVGCRRTVVFQLNNTYLKNTEYFSNLRKHLDNPEVARAFFQYLKCYDIVDDTGKQILNFQDVRPKTAYYNEMMRINLPHIFKWLSSIVNNESINPDNIGNVVDVIHNVNRTIKGIRGVDMLEYLNKWLENRGFRDIKYNNTRLGLELKKIYTDGNNGITRIQGRNNVMYDINIEALKAYLKNNNKFDEDAF